MTEAAPTWTILVPTLGQRARLFARLLECLLPQTLPHDGAVTVLGYFNNGTPRIAEIRQTLVLDAPGEYISFIDDDDLVPSDFVEEIMGALATRPDYVGFDVERYDKGTPQGLAHHSLAYGGWYSNADGLFRDISHINPVRTELARLADFRRARVGQGEDKVWVEQMRRYVKSEVVIPRVMYDYLYDTTVSAWRKPNRIRTGFARPEVAHPHFAWHGESPNG